MLLLAARRSELQRVEQRGSTTPCCVGWNELVGLPHGGQCKFCFGALAVRRRPCSALFAENSFSKHWHIICNICLAPSV